MQVWNEVVTQAERMKELERERESTCVLEAMAKQEHEALQKKGGGLCFLGERGGNERGKEGEGGNLI